jgi:hypothetical protein
VPARSRVVSIPAMTECGGSCGCLDKVALAELPIRCAECFLYEEVETGDHVAPFRNAPYRAGNVPPAPTPTRGHLLVRLLTTRVGNKPGHSCSGRCSRVFRKMVLEVFQTMDS